MDVEQCDCMHTWNFSPHWNTVEQNTYSPEQLEEASERENRSAAVLLSDLLKIISS